LVDDLRSREHEVWVSDVSHDFDSQYIRCNIGHYRQLEKIFEDHKFDYVYNLAAEFGRWNGEDFYETMWISNAVGMKNVIRLQERFGFRLIHFSSSEVYGDYQGVMTEDVLEKFSIRQMNDYAISKYVNEQQIMNSRDMFGTETVRVRLFNTYGPGEWYSPYRSVVCLFCYRALHKMPYTVYTGHLRTSTFITDCTRTLANIVDNFIPGEVYNIASTELHDIKTVSDIVLDYLKIDDGLVTYKEHEPQTTLVKKVDNSKSVRDLKHESRVSLNEGIPMTLEWMREVYKLK
jgi:dTDP-glucose 4,6-dehydratase